MNIHRQSIAVEMVGLWLRGASLQTAMVNQYVRLSINAESEVAGKSEQSEQGEQDGV